MAKVIAAVVVVFLGFWMFTDPSSLADVTTSSGAAVWGATSQVFTKLIDFIGAL